MTLSNRRTRDHSALDPIPSSPNGSEQGVIARVTVPISRVTTEQIQTNETPIVTTLSPSVGPSSGPVSQGTAAESSRNGLFGVNYGGFAALGYSGVAAVDISGAAGISPSGIGAASSAARPPGRGGSRVKSRFTLVPLRDSPMSSFLDRNFG